MKEKENNNISQFKKKLLKKIEEKKNKKKLSEEFQDVHWDDVYDVYYDSSN